MTDPARRVAPNRVIRAAATSQFVVALCCISTIARAQEAPPPDSGSRWMIGGTIMMPRADGGFSGEFTFVGVTTATAKPGHPGVDMAFVLAPRALTAGLLLVGVRANVALPIPIGRHAVVTPSAGVSMLGALGGFGVGGGTAGYNGALAVVVFDKPFEDRTPSIGFRAALAQHRFGSGESGTVRMLEIGLVRLSR